MNRQLFGKSILSGCFHWTFGLLVLISFGFSFAHLILYRWHADGLRRTEYFHVLNYLSDDGSYQIDIEGHAPYRGEGGTPFLDILKEAKPVEGKDDYCADFDSNPEGCLPLASEAGVTGIAFGYDSDSSDYSLSLSLPNSVHIYGGFGNPSRFYTIEPELVERCFDLADEIVWANQAI